MTRFIIVSIATGLIFGFLDGAINANPLAQNVLAFYSPVARQNINIAAGIIIDLAYGFIMAWLFVLIYKGLPGWNGFAKGVSYGLIMWFFRGMMYAVSQWMIIRMPVTAAVYLVVTSAVEMVLLGVFLGVTLKPSWAR